MESFSFKITPDYVRNHIKKDGQIPSNLSFAEQKILADCYVLDLFEENSKLNESIIWMSNSFNA